MRSLALESLVLAALSTPVIAQSDYCRAVDGALFDGQAFLFDDTQLPTQLTVGSRLVDFDGDGTCELAVSSVSSSQSWITIYEGLAEGDLEVLYASTDTGAGKVTSRMLFEDFDQDGLLDVLLSARDGYGQATILELRRGVVGGGFEETSTTIHLGTWTRPPMAVLSGLVDGDSLPDVILLQRGNGTPNRVRCFLSDGSGGLSEATWSPIDVLGFPQSLAVADLNGDGRVDLLTSNVGPRDVSILLSSPTGYLPAQSLFAGQAGMGLAVADLDADGIQDLVFGEFETDSVHVALGTGGVGFNLVETFEAQQDARLIEVADMDGDGVLDLTLACWNLYIGSRVEVHRGLGGGQFELHDQFTSTERQIDLDVADLDGDGLGEVVTHARSLGVVLYEGRPADELGTRLIDLDEPGPVEPGDVNEDGVLDLVQIAESAASPAVIVRLGLGDGDYAAPTSTPLAQGLQTSSFELVDAVGDDSLDLLLLSRGGAELVVLQGDGTGAFTLHSSHTLAQGLSELSASDLEGDGDVDIVVASDEYGFSTDSMPGAFVLRGDGLGGFEPAVHLPTGAGADGIASADVDGDGVQDLILVTQAGVAIVDNNAGGTYGIGATLLDGLDERELACPDLDGDGVADLVLWGSDFAGEICTMLGDGSGGFTPTWCNAPGSAGPNAAEEPCFVDLDGDGIVDLVHPIHGDGDLVVRLGTGGGVFGPATAFDCGGLNPVTVALDDLDLDGVPDAVVVGPGGTGTVNVLIGAGDGSFLAASSYGLPSAGTDVRLSDVTGDGVNDLIVSCPGAQQLVLLVGLGNGTFLPADPIATSTPPLDELRIADVDGDATPDVLAATVGGTVHAWGNSGGLPWTALGPQVSGHVELDSWEVGDWDGDGRVDLLLRDRGFVGEVHLGLASGGFELAHRYLLGGDGEPRVADLDGDGSVDLCLLDRFEEQLLAWRGYGDGTFKAARSSQYLGRTRDLEVVDLDADGELDVVALTHGDRPLQVLTDLADSMRVRDVCGAAELEYGSNIHDDALDVADFDGDGLLDVAMQSQSLINVFLASGSCAPANPGEDGGLRFDESQAFALASGRAFVASADLNGDGVLDALSANGNGEILALLHGRRFGPEAYGVAAPNSYSDGAHLSWSGSRSVAANALTLTVEDAPPGQYGIFFYGPERALTPFGSNGFLNVGPGSVGLMRIRPNVQMDGAGSASLTLDFDVTPMQTGPGEITPASTWNFQLWYRDPSLGFNLSDALEVTFCP